VIECKGPTNTRVYTVAVYFRGNRLAKASGHSIQQAEMNAAKEALDNSQDLFPQLDHQKRVIAKSLWRQHRPPCTTSRSRPSRHSPEREHHRSRERSRSSPRENRSSRDRKDRQINHTNISIPSSSSSSTSFFVSSPSPTPSCSTSKDDPIIPSGIE
ncbi:hypothetical protein L9F63_011090, partial [Diploptera punctata]